MQRGKREWPSYKWFQLALLLINKRIMISFLITGQEREKLIIPDYFWHSNVIFSIKREQHLRWLLWEELSDIWCLTAHDHCVIPSFPWKHRWFQVYDLVTQLSVSVRVTFKKFCHVGPQSCLSAILLVFVKAIEFGACFFSVCIITVGASSELISNWKLTFPV